MIETSDVIANNLLYLFDKYNELFNEKLYIIFFCVLEPVGLGVTTQFYNADESSKLSFQANQDVQIFVKDYGEKKSLLGVSVSFYFHIY